MKLLLPVFAVASTVLLGACSSFDEWSQSPASEPLTPEYERPAKALPAPVPATPAPARASGVYNSSTGKIEWRSYDGPPMATPAPRKRWWLF